MTIMEVGLLGFFCPYFLEYIPPLKVYRKGPLAYLQRSFFVSLLVENNI